MYQKKDYDLLNKSLEYTSKKQEKFTKKYNINKKTKFNLNKNGKIEIINKKNKFIGNYEIIGSYSYKTNIFRHAFSNIYLNKPLNNISNKLKNEKTLLFKSNIYEGHKYGRFITSLSLYKKKNLLGYLVKHEKGTPEIYILIKSLKPLID